jgi:hypothetical protein
MKNAVVLFVFSGMLLVLCQQGSPQGSSNPRPIRGFLVADTMKCDGVTDDTAAFNQLVAQAISDKGPSQAPMELQTITLPSGKCRFASAPKAIPAGIKIVGNQNRSGTWLVADYSESNPNSGFLTWDGSFRAAGSGSGGGLESLHISKGSGKTGGSAIKLAGTDDAHRVGFMVFNDLYINSAFGAPGYWHRDFLIDGSCCTTQGSNGVRDIVLTNFHFGQSQPPDEGGTILVLNGVHVYMSNGLVFTSQRGGVHITGLDTSDNRSSHDVLMSNVNIEGSLIIEKAQGVSYSGWLAGKLTTINGVRNCFISGTLEATIDNAGRCGIASEQEIFTPGIVAASSPDAAGTLRLTNGTGVYRFQRKFKSVPICTASDNDAAAPIRVTMDSSQLTITGVGNHLVSYICIGRD